MYIYLKYIMNEWNKILIKMGYPIKWVTQLSFGVTANIQFVQAWI